MAAKTPSYLLTTVPTFSSSLMHAWPLTSAAMPENVKTHFKYSLILLNRVPFNLKAYLPAGIRTHDISPFFGACRMALEECFFVVS